MPGSKPFSCRLAERCLIRVSGPEATPFLQNIVTNDMTAVAPGQAVYACLLTPQGRFLHDFFISTDGKDGFFLECEVLRHEDLIRRLKIFRLRSKVEIEDCSRQFDVYAASAPSAGVASFPDPRLKELGYRFYLPAGGERGGERDGAAYRDWRISLGVPEGSPEIRPEVDTLAHVNLDRLNAASWDKGCYVGQEITTMTQTRGTVKKRMAVVSGHMLSAGDVLLQSGHEVGEVRAVNSMCTQGLVLIKLAALHVPAAPLTCGSGSVVSAHLPKWLEP